MMEPAGRNVPEFRNVPTNLRDRLPRGVYAIPVLQEIRLALKSDGRPEDKLFEIAEMIYAVTMPEDE